MSSTFKLRLENGRNTLACALSHESGIFNLKSEDLTGEDSFKGSNAIRIEIPQHESDILRLQN